MNLIVKCLLLSLLVAACHTGEKDKELDVNSLDPNAPALPPEANPAPNAVAESSVPTPAPESVKEETTTPPPAAVASEAPPATPKVEELVEAPQAKSPESIGTLDDDEEAVSTPPPPANASNGVPNGEPRVFGTGKQKRFIKADQLHIRVQPDRYSKSIGIMYGGDEVHVTIRGDWAKLEEGKWIRSRWLVKTMPKKFKTGQSAASPSDDDTKPVKKKKRRRSKRKAQE